MLELLPEGVQKHTKPQKRYLSNKRESAVILPSATSLEMTKQSFMLKQIAKDRAMRKRHDLLERGSMPELNRTTQHGYGYSIEDVYDSKNQNFIQTGSSSLA